MFVFHWHGKCYVYPRLNLAVHQIRVHYHCVVNNVASLSDHQPRYHLSSKYCIIHRKDASHNIRLKHYGLKISILSKSIPDVVGMCHRKGLGKYTTMNKVWELNKTRIYIIAVLVNESHLMHARIQGVSGGSGQPPWMIQFLKIPIEEIPKKAPPPRAKHNYAFVSWKNFLDPRMWCILIDPCKFVLKSNHSHVLNTAVEDWIVLSLSRHCTAFLYEFREVLFLMHAHYYCITFAASLVLYLESIKRTRFCSLFFLWRCNWNQKPRIDPLPWIQHSEAPIQSCHTYSPLVRFYRRWCAFCRPTVGRWWTETSAEAGVLCTTGYNCRLLLPPKSGRCLTDVPSFNWQ